MCLDCFQNLDLQKLITMLLAAMYLYYESSYQAVRVQSIRGPAPPLPGVHIARLLRGLVMR
eukprot:4517429-Pleurochrysis_carterae.AAC.2